MNTVFYIFFDLDGTIFDFEKCEIHALTRAFQMNSFPVRNDIFNYYFAINADLWKLYELHQVDLNYLLVRRFDLLAKHFGITISANKMSDDYQKCLSDECYLEPEAMRVLNELKKKYILYVMSNGVVATQLSRIKKASIGKYFRDIFISEEIGFNKPQIDYFDICFKRAGIDDRSRSLIVGDSLTSDIQGGNEAGMMTCWYNPKNKKASHNKINCNYEINKLSQLLSILA